jgi:hypothetical protein
MPDQKIPPYYGRPNEDLDAWSYTLKSLFKLNDVPKNKWVQLAGLYVRDSAQYMYRKILKEYPNIKWSKFIRKFWDCFMFTNYQQNLRTRLLNLKQDDNIQDYINNFNKIISQINNMSLDDQLHAFLRGLKQKTRIHVSTQQPKSLVEAIQIAVQFDLLNFTKIDNQIVHVKSAQMHREQRLRKNYKSKWINKEKEKSLKYGDKCFKCKKSGHWARDCRVKVKSEKTTKKTYAKLSRNRDLTSDDDNQRNGTNSIKPNSDKAKRETFVISGAKASAFVSVFKTSARHCELLKTVANVKDLKVSAVLDTAATSSIMSDRVAKKLKLRLRECEVEVEAVDGSKIKPLGITETISFKVYNRIFFMEFYVLPIEACDLLLGLDWFYVSKACINV